MLFGDGNFGSQMIIISKSRDYYKNQMFIILGQLLVSRVTTSTCLERLVKMSFEPSISLAEVIFLNFSDIKTKLID